VKDRKGKIIAGMNIGVHAARVSVAELVDRLLPILREHARMLEQLLG
jgi:IclR family pca regulon transcriptional regulator